MDDISTAKRDAMFAAIFTSNRDEFLRAIESGADIMSTNNDTRSIIHEAVVSYDPNMVQLVREHGADLDAQDDMGYTALHFSAMVNMPEITTMLLDAGANLSLADNEGASVLHEAVDEGDLNIAQHVIDYGAELDAQDDEGCTPLHYAAIRNQPACAELLLNAGANPLLTDNGGKLPSHRAKSPDVQAMLEAAEAKWLHDRAAERREALADTASSVRASEELATQTGYESVMVASGEAHDAAIERQQRAQQAMSGQLADGGLTHAQEQRRKYGRAM